VEECAAFTLPLLRQFPHRIPTEKLTLIRLGLIAPTLEQSDIEALYQAAA
jgi:hypothetical protein